MNTSLALTLFVLALGVAVTPAGIIGVLAFLTADRRKGLLFALGLTTAVVFGCVLGLVLSNPSTGASSPAGPSWHDIIVLLLGLIVFGAGVYVWRQPPESISGPLGKALAAIDQTPLWLAYGLGTMMVNFIPAIVAVDDIQAAKLTSTQALAYFVFFFVIASSTWSVPVVASLVAAGRWAAFSSRIQGWMLQHGNAVLGIVVVIIGVFMIWHALQPMLAG